MKKIFNLLSILIITQFIYSCEKLSYRDKYIDLDINQIECLNSNQFADYQEAIRRLQKHLIHRNNQLVLNIETAKEVNISNRLFVHLAMQLSNFNVLYEKLHKENQVVIETGRYRYMIIQPDDKFSFVKVKGGGEDEFDNERKGENGGVTSIEITPYSIEFNISNATLNLWKVQLQAGAAISTIVGGYVTSYCPYLAPTVGGSAVIVGGISALLSIGVDELSSIYPNGLTLHISTTGITVVDYILSGVSPQTPNPDK